MPDTDAAQALGLIERLRSRIAATRFLVDAHRIHITLSAGLSACRLKNDSQDEVVSRADRALYAPKEAGRNRVCVDTDCAEQALAHRPPSA